MSVIGMLRQLEGNHMGESRRKLMAAATAVEDATVF